MPRNDAKDSLIFCESLLSPCNFVRTANILVGRREYFLITYCGVQSDHWPIKIGDGQPRF
jgi:hypothetical protein